MKSIVAAEIGEQSTLESMLDDLNAFYGDGGHPEPISPTPKPCECGCDSVGAQKHSDYCPKYKAEQNETD